jgi:hypothetical protein
MTVSPYHYVLHIYKGAKLATPLIFERAGVPVDFTGRTARCQFRAEPDGDVVFSITPVLGGITGELLFSMTATETTAIDDNISDEYTQYRGQVEIVSDIDAQDVDRYVDVTAIVYPEWTR